MTNPIPFPFDTVPPEAHPKWKDYCFYLHQWRAFKDYELYVQCCLIHGEEAAKDMLKKEQELKSASSKVAE